MFILLHGLWDAFSIDLIKHCQLNLHTHTSTHIHLMLINYVSNMYLQFKQKLTISCKCISLGRNELAFISSLIGFTDLKLVEQAREP